MDINKFYGGSCFDAYEFLGAHIEKGAVTFRTYAPNASKVALIGDFSDVIDRESFPFHFHGILNFCL